MEKKEKRIEKLSFMDKPIVVTAAIAMIALLYDIYNVWANGRMFYSNTFSQLTEPELTLIKILATSFVFTLCGIAAYHLRMVFIDVFILMTAFFFITTGYTRYIQNPMAILKPSDLSSGIGIAFVAVSFVAVMMLLCNALVVFAQAEQELKMKKHNI